MYMKTRVQKCRIESRYENTVTPEKVWIGWSGRNFEVTLGDDGTQIFPLILGGAEIPHPKGLDGHSDADVLTHAVMDALLGAAGLGDIGKHFPDTDPAYKGISSMALLKKVVSLLDEKGLRVSNLDATIIAQAPKMAPHIPQMAANIALGGAAVSVLARNSGADVRVFDVGLLAPVDLDAVRDVNVRRGTDDFAAAASIALFFDILDIGYIFGHRIY